MAGEYGGGDDDDDVSIESQLEQQLEEQKESLAAVTEALASEPSNPELLEVHEELRLAIKDAEEGLLHLRRSRLLKEADIIFSGHEPEHIVGPGEPLDPGQVEPEPLEAGEYSVGSKCRFRHTDGHWYNGHIVGFEDASSARICFLTPTSESMMMCKFFLQQRCRFGSNCRMSHGVTIPVSSLKEYFPTIWQQSLVGSSIWADSRDHSGIWRKAELESWNNKLGLGQVIFQEDGSSAELGSDSLSISEYAEMSEGSESSSERSDSYEEEEEPENESDHQGLGFFEATKLLSGVQTETIVFAKWEHHTRGIASKMMASMGYREGMGLGISGQGITDPVLVKALRGKQSLERHLALSKAGEESAGQGKKRSRGGRRKRERKFAEAARAAKAEEERAVFSFINNQLAPQEAMNVSGGKVRRKVGKGEMIGKKEDRRSLVAYDDEVKELRSRVERLQEMANRNQHKDKVVYEAALRKLGETRRALEDAEAAHASASDAVVSKEKEKKWLKF